MFSHTWKRRSVCQVSEPIHVNGGHEAWLDGFRTIRHSPEHAAWKWFDTPAGIAGRHPRKLTRAADFVLRRLVGLLYVHLCVINSAYRSPVLHWIPPRGIYSFKAQSIIANTCTTEGGGVCVCVRECGPQNLNRRRGWRCLSPQELFSVSIHLIATCFFYCWRQPGHNLHIC